MIQTQNSKTSKNLKVPTKHQIFKQFKNQEIRKSGQKIKIPKIPEIQKQKTKEQ